MKPKTREWIVDEVEKMFIWGGASDFESGVAIFKKLAGRMQEAHQTMSSKEHFASLLDSSPEPNWMERRFIQGAFRYVPQLLLYGLKQAARTAEDTIPKLPSGRPGLDAYDKARMVAEISRKELRGCTHRQAKQRTALQFGVSLSTVQRAWDDRANTSEVDFRSVLKYLSSDGELIHSPAKDLAG